MDEYYLSKEEWDTIVELGLGDNKDDVVLKKIPTATKTSLTRKCVKHLFYFSRVCVIFMALFFCFFL